jgi:hypothetical protein
VKLYRFRKPKAAYFLSYVEYRSNINTSNTMKNRSLYRKATYRRGRGKEGS